MAVGDKQAVWVQLASGSVRVDVADQIELNAGDGLAIEGISQLSLVGGADESEALVFVLD